MPDLPINTLSRRPKQNREPLPAAPDPEAIPAQRNVQGRLSTDDSTADGIAWDLKQQEYTGTDFIMHTDSTGLFVVEQPRDVPYTDGSGGSGNITGREHP